MARIVRVRVRMSVRVKVTVEGGVQRTRNVYMVGPALASYIGQAM